jgi:hypothetical protein
MKKYLKLKEWTAGVMLVIALCIFLAPVAETAMTANLDKYEPWSVEASSTAGEDAEPALAADNNLTTRWSSDSGEQKTWIMFDYGLRKYIQTIVIAWEAAYAKVYRIQVSEDGEHWRTVFVEHQGHEGLQVIQFSSMVRGRYVRLQCSQKANDDYGYSIFEFQIYGEQ